MRFAQPIIPLILSLLSAAPFCAAQTASDDTLRTIQQFHTCVSGLADMSQSPERRTAVRLNSDNIVKGLTTDWGKIPMQDAIGRMPPEYRDHLRAATKACEAQMRQARTSLSGPKPVRDADLDAFATDLALKVDDCRKFTMGRMIPVEIRVVTEAGLPDGGWSVFYKWLPGSAAAAVIELPFPGPTPNAQRSLPPGLYSVHAQKSKSGKLLLTAATTVPVGGTEKVVISIPAP